MTTDFHEQLNHLARKHHLSDASAQQLVTGLLRSNGAQVQFNIPEFGGMGQWMSGMVMVGNFSDPALKARVDAVCSEISQAVRSGNLRLPPDTKDPSGPSFSAEDRAANGWPASLGTAASAGAQNDMRYAWFPQTRRLAIELSGHLRIYDTADHIIGGVSQQQSGKERTLVFTSQHGVVNVSSLRAVD